jgi:hypothetical protein
MSETFTKLFSSLTDSTIWAADDQTRLVWITMLAMADQHGYVGASIPGLAARARVPVEAVEVALNTFLAPDKYSRSQEFEGRRIEVADRGWTLLNYGRFRDTRDEEARRKYERERKRAQRAKAGRSRDVTESPAVSAQAEAEAEAEADTTSSTTARERLPEDYRPDYDALRRASHSPETLDREVLALTSGRHPTIDHLTPEDVGVGMRELVLAGAPQSKLSRFAQVARDQRLHPRPSGGHFRAGHDDDEAARQRLLAKYPEEARAT